MDLGSLGVDGMKAAAGSLSTSADSYENQQDVELSWAIKAYHHAETYFNLISSVDNRRLNLGKHDDEIYEQFRKDFPDFDVKLIDEDKLKSESAKSKWRPFCNHFDGQVEDFNFGTLLRLDCTQDYSDKNSVFVTRIQFYAIEIARNREGENLVVFNKPTTKDNDKTDGEKTGSDKTDDDKTGSEKAGSDKTDDDKTGSDKADGDKTDGDKTDDDKTGSDKTDAKKDES